MQAKKRLYVGLLGFSLIMVIGIAALVWYIFTHRDILVNQVLLIGMLVIAAVIFAVLGLGILAIVMMIIRCKSFPSLETLTQWANGMLFPLTLLTGRFFGIDKDKILKSFISVNNYLVGNKNLALRCQDIMILLPHCLQNSECKFKITIDINNCRNCGKCKIGALKELAEQYRVKLRVATGGTLARKWIKETKPKAVIAVACERDLSAGIQDTGELPVLGVLNCRPHGPCLNTDVDVAEIERALLTISKGGCL
ncbi:MAG: DUF116 domain-containing protein [Syntrophomonadaceae bacterium]|jgi:hypothetical protein|nr:DUF116 domain-containing protein [Syntrophomonadaceae bacterium]